MQQGNGRDQVVRLNDPEGGPSIEMVRVDESLEGTARAREISEAIDSSLGDAPPKSRSPAAVSVGEIDLSVASVMGLSAAVLATLNDGKSVPFGVAILIALAAGAAAGVVQGWCVSRLGLPSLVVTLAGLIGLRGLARVFVEDRSYGGFP